LEVAKTSGVSFTGVRVKRLIQSLSSNTRRLLRAPWVLHSMCACVCVCVFKRAISVMIVRKASLPYQKYSV